MLAAQDVEMRRALGLGLGLEELHGLLEGERAGGPTVLVLQQDLLETDQDDPAVDEREADMALHERATMARPAADRLAQSPPSLQHGDVHLE